jgi:hypothetical protein
LTVIASSTVIGLCGAAHRRAIGPTARRYPRPAFCHTQPPRVARVAHFRQFIKQLKLLHGFYGDFTNQFSCPLPAMLSLTKSFFAVKLTAVNLALLSAVRARTALLFLNPYPLAPLKSQQVTQLPSARMAKFERLRDSAALGRVPNADRAFEPVPLAYLARGQKSVLDVLFTLFFHKCPPFFFANGIKSALRNTSPGL